MSGMDYCELVRKFHSRSEKEDWLWNKRSYDFTVEDIIFEEKIKRHLKKSRK